MFVLINWIWGAGLLVIGVSLWARAARRAPAALRYRVWWAALAVVLAMPAVALWPAAPQASLRPAPPDALVLVPAHASVVGAGVLALWLAWSAWAVARVGGALVALRRLRRSCMPFPAARARALRQWQAARGRGRRALLKISPAVGSAAVLGGPTPIIAVSPALLRHLNDEDLDRIVLHEWAHVQRRDDVAQAVQEIVRAIAGLHPAVWWASRQLRLERELACDEHVVYATGSPVAYAACLARLADLTSGRETTLAPAALGRPQLAIRIVRLVRTPAAPSCPRGLAWSAAVLLALAPAGAVRVPLVGAFMPSIDRLIPPARIPPTGLPAGLRAVVVPDALDPAGARIPRLPARAAAPAQLANPTVGTPDAVAARAPSLSLPGPRSLAYASGVEPRVPSLPAGSPAASLLPGASVRVAAPAGEQATDPAAASPWSAAAEAGETVGRGMTAAGRTTAGFFTRLGKSIGGAF